MKVCIPIKDTIRYDVSDDLNNTKNIFIFDSERNTHFTIDTSSMNLGQIIEFLLSNNIKAIISPINIPQHYKYIATRNIAVYDPIKNLNAIENMNLFKSNQVNSSNVDY